MDRAPIYTHDRTALVVVHHRTGHVALASRVDVECARSDEVRREVCTSFMRLSDCRRNLRDPATFPRGEILAAPSPEAARWRDAVAATLDEYAALSSMDQYFDNLQKRWRAGP